MVSSAAWPFLLLFLGLMLLIFVAQHLNSRVPLADLQSWAAANGHGFDADAAEVKSALIHIEVPRFLSGGYSPDKWRRGVTVRASPPVFLYESICEVDAGGTVSIALCQLSLDLPEFVCSPKWSLTPWLAQLTRQKHHGPLQLRPLAVHDPKRFASADFQALRSLETLHLPEALGGTERTFEYCVASGLVAVTTNGSIDAECAEELLEQLEKFIGIIDNRESRP